MQGKETRRRIRKASAVLPPKEVGQTSGSPGMELSPEPRAHPKTDRSMMTRESTGERSPLALGASSDPMCEVHFSSTLRRLAQKNRCSSLQISERHRAAIFDWVVEVMAVYEQRDSTLFRCAALIDGFYAQNPSISPSDIHLTGAAAIAMASKLDNVKYIRLGVIQENICQGKFSKEEIAIRETELFKANDFRVAQPTQIELLATALALLPLDASQRAFVSNSATMILRMCLFTREMSSECSPAELTGLAIILGLKIMGQILPDPKIGDVVQIVAKKFELAGPLFFPKLQALHQFTVDFESIVPQAKNLRHYNSFSKAL